MSRSPASKTRAQTTPMPCRPRPKRGLSNKTFRATSARECRPQPRPSPATRLSRCPTAGSRRALRAYEPRRAGTQSASFPANRRASARKTASFQGTFRRDFQKFPDGQFLRYEFVLPGNGKRRHRKHRGGRRKDSPFHIFDIFHRFPKASTINVTARCARNLAERPQNANGGLELGRLSVCAPVGVAPGLLGLLGLLGGFRFPRLRTGALGGSLPTLAGSRRIRSSRRGLSVSRKRGACENCGGKCGCDISHSVSLSAAARASGSGFSGGRSLSTAPRERLFKNRPRRK